MLFQKKKQQKLEYDRENQKPVLRCSICNGEQVAGLKDLRSGRFHEVMFVRDEKEVKEFMEMCGISEITKEY
ncbi:MAG: aspartate dehydrogenase [Eubacterium sp.]|nr:aspartate dehydrogenase [Eubacterium sp.]MCI8917424.1 aspartate dehydrogenase [Eubacterium sp.]